MIFRPELAAKVLDGTKTVTRRIPRGASIYHFDREYAVQPGRGQFHVGHIVIVEVGRERLRDITDDEARREGFDNVAEFATYWQNLHGSIRGDTVVDRIAFRLLPRRECCAELTPTPDGAAASGSAGAGGTA